MQVNVFVFDAAPETFDKHVVEGTPATIHTDQDLSLAQDPSKFWAGELTALIGVEDHRFSGRQGVLQGAEAEQVVQGVRELPGQHVAAVPVDHGHQVQESRWHRHIGDVRRPHQVGVIQPHPAQQVGVHGMLWMGFTGMWTGDTPLDSHQSHQALYALAIDVVALAFQPQGHLSGAKEGCAHVLLINEPHVRQILFSFLFPLRLVVVAGTYNAQELTLSANTQVAIVRFDQHALILRTAQQIFFSTSRAPSLADRSLQRGVP